MDPDVDAAIEKEAAAWAQHFGVTDPEQIEGRKQVMRANVAAGHTKPLDEFLAGGRAFSPHGGVAAAPKKARKARVAAAPAPKARKARAAAEKAPKAPNAGPGKFAAIREAAERGELPPVPDFSADLHKRNRGRLAQLVAMAEAGDIAGLEAFPIKPNCTSPKAMDRYRNLCVIALKACAARPTA